MKKCRVELRKNSEKNTLHYMPFLPLMYAAILEYFELIREALQLILDAVGGRACHKEQTGNRREQFGVCERVQLRNIPPTYTAEQQNGRERLRAALLYREQIILKIPQELRRYAPHSLHRLPNRYKLA